MVIQKPGPKRVTLENTQCLGAALFYLFVSAKYLALNCNSLNYYNQFLSTKYDSPTFKGDHRGFH